MHAQLNCYSNILCQAQMLQSFVKCCIQSNEHYCVIFENQVLQIFNFISEISTLLVTADAATSAFTVLVVLLFEWQNSINIITNVVCKSCIAARVSTVPGLIIVSRPCRCTIYNLTMRGDECFHLRIIKEWSDRKAENNVTYDLHLLVPFQC